MSNKGNQKQPVHTNKKKNLKQPLLNKHFKSNKKIVTGIATFALGTFMAGGLLILPQAEAQQGYAPSNDPIRDVVGTLTKHIDHDSIEFNVEGTSGIYRCAGETACQEELNSFKLGSGLLIQFTETKNDNYTIKNIEVLYEPETDEIEKIITANYDSMPNQQTIKVYIDKEPHLLPLADYLHEQDIATQFVSGTEVTLLIREDIYGKMTVGAVNEL